MRLQLGPESYVVMDLDDTLYAEADFVRSGFAAVARMLAPVVGADLLEPMWERFEAGQDAFGWAVERLADAGSGLDVGDLLDCYRTHRPRIELGPGVLDFLHRARACGAGLGVVTDGRSRTQRNKIDALGIADLLDDIVVSEEIGSEKPDPRNFAVFVDRHPGARFAFIGDNTTKDFVVPSRLGWHTVCVLDTGRHVHRQDLSATPRPDDRIRTFADIEVVPRDRAAAR